MRLESTLFQLLLDFVAVLDAFLANDDLVFLPAPLHIFFVDCIWLGHHFCRFWLGTFRRLVKCLMKGFAKGLVKGLARDTMFLSTSFIFDALHLGLVLVFEEGDF